MECFVPAFELTLWVAKGWIVNQILIFSIDTEYISKKEANF